MMGGGGGGGGEREGGRERQRETERWTRIGESYLRMKTRE